MYREKIEQAKTIIMPITGGIGRNIFATAVINNFRKVYPTKKLIVVAGYPDIFINNPQINRVYSFNTVQHLYEDYIDKNPDTLLLEVEPYRHPDYITGNKHIVTSWCELLEIPCDDIMPKLFFSKSEKDIAKAYINKFDKPMILLQHTGGPVPNNNSSTEMDKAISQSMMYRRSLREETIQKLVTMLSESGYLVGSVQATNQFSPEKTEKISFPLRAIFCLIPYVKGIISIDSFLHHASAALNVPSLVLWMGTSPEKLGYGMHKNLRRNECPTPECHRPNSYAFDILTNGSQWVCPHNDLCTDYEAQMIFDEYKQMKGEAFTKEVTDFKPVKQDKEASNTPSTCTVHSH